MKGFITADWGAESVVAHDTGYHPALEQARRIQPQIPLIGEYGIPLRDKIELVNLEQAQ